MSGKNRTKNHELNTKITARNVESSRRALYLIQLYKYRESGLGTALSNFTLPVFLMLMLMPYSHFRRLVNSDFRIKSILINVELIIRPHAEGRSRTSFPNFKMNVRRIVCIHRRRAFSTRVSATNEVLGHAVYAYVLPFGLFIHYTGCIILWVKLDSVHNRLMNKFDTKFAPPFHKSKR